MRLQFKLIFLQFHSGIFSYRCPGSEPPPWCLSEAIRLIECHFVTPRGCWALTALNESCALHPCQIPWQCPLSSLLMRNDIDDLERKKSPLCPAVYRINLSNTEAVYACVVKYVRARIHLFNDCSIIIRIPRLKWFIIAGWRLFFFFILS